MGMGGGGGENGAAVQRLGREGGRGKINKRRGEREC